MHVEIERSSVCQQLVVWIRKQSSPRWPLHQHLQSAVIADEQHGGGGTESPADRYVDVNNCQMPHILTGAARQPYSTVSV